VCYGVAFPPDCVGVGDGCAPEAVLSLLQISAPPRRLKLICFLNLFNFIQVLEHLFICPHLIFQELKRFGECFDFIERLGFSFFS